MLDDTDEEETEDDDDDDDDEDDGMRIFVALSMNLASRQSITTVDVGDGVEDDDTPIIFDSGVSVGRGLMLLLLLQVLSLLILLTDRANLQR